MSHPQNHSQSSLIQEEILLELKGLLTGYWLTDLSNTAALLMQHYRRINWVGFYLTAGNAAGLLRLGPFQGLPACTDIAFGKGVCGTAAVLKKTIVVPNVDQFPGHIACDSQSKSEIVVPLILENQVVGVLDVDSAELDRFKEEDQIFFEKVVRLLEPSLKSL